MDINQLCTVLAACIGTDAAQRTAAEEVLKQVRKAICWRSVWDRGALLRCCAGMAAALWWALDRCGEDYSLEFVPGILASGVCSAAA